MDDFSGAASESGSGISQGSPTTHQQGSGLPGYFPYMSLGFKLIMTIIILPMAGWVFATIKANRKLHKPHNIFVANLMVIDISIVLLQSSQSIAAIVAYAIGVDDLLSCSVKQFLLFPVMLIHFTSVMISVDKVIAIAFPFKHTKIMTRHTIGGVIIASWLLAILLCVNRLFKDYSHLADHDLCVSLVLGNRSESFFIRILPILLGSLLTLLLNIYLANKAYKVYSQIRKETRLSSVSNEVETLKKKLSKIKRDLKPVITLLMVLVGSGLIAQLFILLINLSASLWDYEITTKIDQAFSATVMYAVVFLHPLVYGLYFKEIRQPLVAMLKKYLCKSKFNTATVAPMPQRTA